MKKLLFYSLLVLVFTLSAAGCAAEDDLAVLIVTESIPPTKTLAPTVTATLLPPTATHTLIPSPTIPPPTPTLSPSLSALQIAFVDENRQIWLWQNETIRPLTTSNLEGYIQVKISDDGSLIAFSSNGELWVINSDGSNERLLVSAGDFQSLAPRDPGVGLSQFDWIPETHLLMFNTKLLYEYGLAYTDDLYSVNADSMRWKRLRQPGEGGEFIFSPDGKRVALVTPFKISLMEVDNNNYRTVLEYIVSTGSQTQYYADPVWTLDSQSLIVAIPPTYSRPKQLANIWRLSIEDYPPEIILQLPEGESRYYKIYWFFSPSTNYYAIFSEEDHRFYLASNGENLEPLTEPFPNVGWFSWIDETHFLYLWNCSLQLGTIGAPGITIVDKSTIDNCVADYDFTN